jgi:Ca2+-binding RTX toxin-like protein
MPTQSTDITGTPNGITYTTIGETWETLKGVDVRGTTFGIFSAFADSVLDNNGSIFGDSAGVFFDSDGAASNWVVKNKAKGEIQGAFAVVIDNFVGSALVENKGQISSTSIGVYMKQDGSARIVNDGAIKSAIVGIQSETPDLTVENTGVISGAYGVRVSAAGSGPVTAGTLIENDGKVKGFYAAIEISGDTGVAAQLINRDDGVIKSNYLTAIRSTERLYLKNDGKVVGRVFTSGYDDQIINKGKIKGGVNLGSGIDTFKSKANAKAGMIDTQDGNDLVVLGGKADKLLFASALTATTNVDTVKKFVSGNDMVYLDDDIFSAITPGTLSASQFHKGASAADADDRIIYDKASGALSYDPDGIGGVAQTQFASFDSGTKLNALDFRIGEYSTFI